MSGKVSKDGVPWWSHEAEGFLQDSVILLDSLLNITRSHASHTEVHRGMCAYVFTYPPSHSPAHLPTRVRMLACVRLVYTSFQFDKVPALHDLKTFVKCL